MPVIAFKNTRKTFWGRRIFRGGGGFSFSLSFLYLFCSFAFFSFFSFGSFLFFLFFLFFFFVFFSFSFSFGKMTDFYLAIRVYNYFLFEYKIYVYNTSL